MYPLPEFRVKDWEEILRFIEKYPFATLTGSTADGGLVATHIPLLITPHKTELILRGHMMRKTDQWSAFRANRRALAIFSGPNAPILASWQTNGPFGGTWNYQAVHAHGSVRFLSEAELRENLRDLKDRFEDSPDHQFEGLPEDYLSRLIPGIDCFELRVERVEGVFKLSQNRSLEEFDNTVHELRGVGGESALVAEAMRERRRLFFPGAD